MMLMQVTGPASGGDMMKSLEWMGLVVAPILSAVIAWKVATRKKERVRVEPDPLRVRKVTEKATEDNCKERHTIAMEALETMSRQNDDEHRRIHEKIDSLVSKEIHEMERRLDDKSERRSGDIHDRVNLILEAVGEVRGQLKLREDK